MERRHPVGGTQASCLLSIRSSARHSAITEASRILTNLSSPTASSSSKRDNKGLSRSNTPINRSPFFKGTTISEFDAESQEMCPGNSRSEERRVGKEWRE